MNVKVIKVKFSNSNRVYNFLSNELEISKETFVVVESERGLQVGKTCSDVFEISREKIIDSLKKVVRIATEDDLEQNRINLSDAFSALTKARNIVNNLGIKMNILNSYFTFDRNQLVFNFIAEDRVDFRELAKKLASIYKTRIELRQIGVRDKAKEVGGIGPCGRFLCCNLFLNEFDSVSINMAKNQYISLKPDKINGICGRLLCCLNYEDSQYTELKKALPPIGSSLKYQGEKVKVVSHNVFNKSFIAEKQDKTLITLNHKDYESIK